MECMIEVNKHRAERLDECPTCKQRFVGVLAMAIAEARVHDKKLDFDGKATSDLAQAYLEQGNLPEALKLYRQCLRQTAAEFGQDHLNTATIQECVAIVAF